MKNYCTIYSHELCFDNMIAALEKHFPKGKTRISNADEQKIIHVSIKEGLLKSKKEFQISYRERTKPSYQIAEMDSPLTQNLSGMLNYVDSLPSNNPEIKNLLIRKIQTINTEFAISSKGDLNDEVKALVQQFSTAHEAILFTNSGTNISKSTAQHFLDKNLELILDSDGNSDIEQLNVGINSIYFDGDQETVTEDQKNRKAKSEEIITAKNLKLNKNLPYIESEESTTIRTAKEIAERVTVLAVTNMVAFNGIEAEEALAYLKEYHLFDKATPKEIAFLNNPTEEAKNQETWKCECMWVLLWAIQVTDELNFPDTMADLNAIPTESYPIGKDKDPYTFINKITASRGKSEILDANDLYYRIDWTCVDARINELELTDVIPGVVYERHYALNWLVNYNGQDWDDVSCDT